MPKKLVLLPLVVAVSACTSLNVHKLTDASTAEAREGIAYYLPVKQLQMDVAFRLTGCRVVDNKPVFSYATSAKVAEVQVPDLAERYTISYRDLAAITKTTDLTVTTSEQGLLVSVNATVTDQTGPILSSLASAGFSLARATALRAVAFPVSITTYSLRLERLVPPIADPCSAFKTRLDAAGEAAASLDDAVASDELRAEAVGLRNKAAIALKVAEANLKEATDAKDAAPIAEAKPVVVKAKAAFEVAQKNLDVLPASTTKQMAANLEDALAAITVMRKLMWTPLSAPNAAQLSQMVAPTKAAFQTLKFTEADAAAAAGAMRAEVTIEPLGNMGTLKDVALLPKAGIVYRQPAHLLLKVCGNTCKQTDPTPAPGVVLGDQFAYAAVHAFPQFGAKATLPLSNGLFEDNGLEITFGESGQPKKVAFKSKSSAERAAASAKEIGDGYLGFIKARQTDQLDLRKALRTDESDQIDLATKRRDAQLDTLDDRLETLKKYQAFESARAGTSTKDQLLEDSMAARKRHLQLQIDIKEQENKLKALGVTAN